jgi:hypothetical protein
MTRARDAGHSIAAVAVSINFGCGRTRKSSSPQVSRTPRCEILAAEPVAAFEFRWPEGTEAFEGGRLVDARIGGRRHAVRRGLGARTVYGRERGHTVTWLDGGVQVEGVEADDCTFNLHALTA